MKIDWASFGCNLYGSSQEIQFQVKRCLILEGEIVNVKAANSNFFLPNQSLLDIFYNVNCDESFCAWLTEIVLPSNFQKAVIYIHNFQGLCDTTLSHC